MTSFQRAMLAWFKKRNASVAFLAGTWVWREDIRRDPELAAHLYWLVAV